MGFDHDTHYSSLALLNLLGQHCSYFGLVLMVLQTISMAAVDHQPLLQSLASQGLAGLFYTLCIVVGTTSSTTENDEAILITYGANDGHHTRFCDREEVVRMSYGADGVNRNSEAAVSAILETDGERQTRGQFSMKLRLCSSGTDSTDRQQICQELRRNRIEHLTCNWHASSRQVDKELPRQSQALVDLEAVIDLRVIDQTLPSHRRPGLFQVRAHYNQQVVFVFGFELQQPVAVLERCHGIVDGARADDDQQTLSGVSTLNHLGGLFPSLEHRCLGFRRLLDLMLKQIWRRQGIVTSNYIQAGGLALWELTDGDKRKHTSPVFRALLIANILVLNEEL